MTSGSVRRVIERVVREGTVVARSDGSVHEVFPVAIPASEGEALREWVIREGAARTVEIGLGYGVSALYVCDGLVGNAGAGHTVVDPHQATRFADCGLQVLGDARVADLVEHYAEPSEIVLPGLLEEGHRFDLAVVDGNHRFDGVFVDLFYLGRLVRPGGVVFLDDYQLPAVRKAAAFFVKNLDWALEDDSGPDDLHRWAVLRTSQHSDTRPFDHFVDF